MHYISGCGLFLAIMVILYQANPVWSDDSGRPFMGGDYFGGAPTASRPYQRTVESRVTFSGDPKVNM